MSMKVERVRRWMENVGKDALDIASATGLDRRTVTKYLEGKPVHRSTRLVIEGFVLDEVKKGDPLGPKAA